MIGIPIGPTAEEIERIQQFPNRNYSETVRRYEELLAELEVRMRETTVSAEQTPHSTPTKHSKSHRTPRTIKHFPASGTPKVSLTRTPHERPTFYRPYVGNRRLLPKHKENTVPGKERLHGLHCHEASPYVYREPFRIVENDRDVRSPRISGHQDRCWEV